MAQNLTATQESAGKSQELMRSPRTLELVKIVGASAAINDTSNAYACQVVQNPSVVIGWPGSVAFSGQNVTFTTCVALGNSTMWVWVGNSI